jgi:hypothetical protein
MEVLTIIWEYPGGLFIYSRAISIICKSTPEIPIKTFEAQSIGISRFAFNLENLDYIDIFT